MGGEQGLCGSRPEANSLHALAWLMPAAFTVHIGEEFFGGFQSYVIARMHGPPMGDTAFLINNAVFMTILLALSIQVSRRPSRTSAFLLMCWASGNLFWDFLVHLGYTVGTGMRRLSRAPAGRTLRGILAIGAITATDFSGQKSRVD
jgi:hypothetical protein